MEPRVEGLKRNIPIHPEGKSIPVDVSQRISRREVIETLGRGFLGLAVSFLLPKNAHAQQESPIYDESPEQIPESSPAFLLKQAMEQKLPIRIVLPKASEFKEESDLDKLKLLDEVLSRFPKAMIDVDTGIPQRLLDHDPDAGKLKITLTSYGHPWLNINHSDSRNSLGFPLPFLERGNIPATTAKLIHEIIHRNTYRDKIMDHSPGYGVEIYQSSEQYRGIYEIFGGHEKIIPPELKKWAEQLKEEILKDGKDWRREVDNIQNFKARLYLGIVGNFGGNIAENTFPSEMPSVLAEQLIFLGVERFMNQLREIMPEDVKKVVQIDKIPIFVQNTLLFGQAPQEFLPKAA